MKNIFCEKLGRQKAQKIIEIIELWDISMMGCGTFLSYLLEKRLCDKDIFFDESHFLPKNDLFFGRLRQTKL